MNYDSLILEREINKLIEFKNLSFNELKEIKLYIVQRIEDLDLQYKYYKYHHSEYIFYLSQKMSLLKELRRINKIIIEKIKFV